MTDANAHFQLIQYGRITLRLAGRQPWVNGARIGCTVGLCGTDKLRGPFLGRFPDLGFFRQAGKTQATRYFVEPILLREACLDGRSIPKRMEPHRMRALIQEDLSLYPAASSGEINRRVARKFLIAH